jgi:hypothetical protein
VSTQESVRPGYPRYVLGVLVAVYVLNFLDRQIVTILADEIKADLGLRCSASRSAVSRTCGTDAR